MGKCPPSLPVIYPLKYAILLNYNLYFVTISLFFHRFPVKMSWKGESVTEDVVWFQNESEPSLNSNAFEVASSLVQKHFPGEFGSEKLVQQVVDTILQNVGIYDVIQLKELFVGNIDSEMWPVDYSVAILELKVECQPRNCEKYCTL